MSTYFPKQGEIARKWYVVDASGKTLGRLASQVARILMGKENPQYTPFLDTVDHVVIIHAEKVPASNSRSSFAASPFMDRSIVTQIQSRKHCYANTASCIASRDHAGETP